MGFFLRSFGMLFAWTGLLMVFTSAAGSPLMLGGLLLAVCGATSLAAHAGRGIARAPGTIRAIRFRHLSGGDGAPSTIRSSPMLNRWGA
jgi:hypothetical protein